MKGILGFDKLITPSILTIAYYFTIVCILIAGIVNMVKGEGALTILGMILLFIVVRVMFELVMIAFKNNEYLRRIAESSERLENK